MTGPIANILPFKLAVVGYASGSVPGKQTVPRAEATALLQALRTTSGDAIFVCDNLGVVRRYRQIFRNRRITSNGLLWNLIVKAKQQRETTGRGRLEVVWLPSHTTFESSLNGGYPPVYWFCNQLADNLAGKAASRHQLPADDLTELAESTSLASSILSRLVDVLILLADDFKLKDVGAIAAKEPRVPKVEIVAKLAKEAGHSLASNFKETRNAICKSI